MRERLDRLWRVFATGLCFACFGLGGLVMRIVLFPLLWLVVRQPADRVRAARWMIRRAFLCFVALMRLLGVLSFEIHGLQRLQRRGLLILANHPSLVDVVFLMGLVEGADCIVKGSLASNPFTRGPVRAAGFVFNDSGAGLVDDCVRSVRNGSNLIIFPEGTRTPRQGPSRLQRGAANVAVRGRFDITPVRIRVTPPTLGKGEPWWRVPDRRPHFVFEIEADIPIDSFIAGGSEALAARRLTDHLADYFSLERPHAAA